MGAFSFQYADKLDSLYQRKSEAAHILSPKFNIYFNASTAVQFYNRSGFGFHSNDTRVVIAHEGQNILPRVFGTDFGIFAKPVDKLLMNLAVWQLHLQQEFVYGGDEAVVEPSGETQRIGLDISLRHQAFKWLYLDIDGNCAHGRTVHDPEGENFIPLAPVLTSMAGLTATLENGIHTSLRYRCFSDCPANENNTVTAQGYFLLDAAVTYSKPGYELSLSTTNLLNSDWNEVRFDTETRLPGDEQGISELTFTPADPFFLKAGFRIFF